MKNKEVHIANMSVLAIINIISFYAQPLCSPFDEINRDNHWLAMCALRVGLIGYLPLIIVGTYSLVKSLSAIINKEQGSPRIIPFITLFSLILVFFGTFFKSSFNHYKWEKERDCQLIIKTYGGNFENGSCIWYGDTLLEKVSDRIDTIIIDKSSNTCHWTYKPEINYEIIFDHRSKFEDSIKNKSYSPTTYKEKFQYIINCVNNKHVDQIYYDESCCNLKFENDSALCFIIESNLTASRKIGFVLFKKENDIAVLVDSSSCIYHASADHKFLPFGFSVKENGMPLLKVMDQAKGNNDNNNADEYVDYYDIETKKLVLHAFSKGIKKDSKTKNNICVEVYLREREQYKGYPVIEYREVNPNTDPRTIETGEYSMFNGMYRKCKY